MSDTGNFDAKCTGKNTKKSQSVTYISSVEHFYTILHKTRLSRLAGERVLLRIGRNMHVFDGCGLFYALYENVIHITRST